MDYVYICRSGENEELRYSIRSIVKNANPDNVWVVGGKPDWYTGKYLEVSDTGNKFENITNCYKALSSLNELSEEFVLMNDDFYILNPIDRVENMYDGLLSDKIDNHVSVNGMSAYARVLVKAKKQLIANGVETPLCYDIHVPMVFNKTMLSYLNHDNNAPRSTYGNMFNIGGKNIKDVKVYNRTKDISLDQQDFVSTEDNSFYLIKGKLESMFPNKTKYER